MLKLKNDISDRALATLGTLNEKHPYALFSAILVVVLLVDYFGIMQFQVGALRKLNTAIHQFKTETKAIRDGEKRISQYQAEAKRLDKKLETIDRMIKGKGDIPDILEDISRIANGNRVRIEQIVPDTVLASPVLKDADGAYYLLPIVVEAKAGYHEFGRFMNQLEGEGVLADLAALEMTSDERQAYKLHRVVMTFHVIIFEPK